MRIGIMLPNWVGDVAMATPTLRALRKHFAGSELIGVVKPYVAAVLEGTSWLDRVFPWEHRGWRGMVASLRFVGQLRQQRIDTWVLLRNSLSAALVARASGAERIVGYRRNGRGLLLTDSLQPPRNAQGLVPISAVDYYLQLAYSLGTPLESQQLELATTPADETQADAVWNRLGLPAGSDVVLLSSTGAYGSAKVWPVEHCAELAKRVSQELGKHVLVLCGPSERENAAAIVRYANHPQVKSLAEEKLSIGLSKALIRRSRLMITTDSGPRHLAAGLGTPTISLFGPTDPVWAENYQPGAVKLRLELDCSPCAKRVCPLGHHRCMRNLPVDRVLAAIWDQLQIPAQRSAA